MLFFDVTIYPPLLTIDCAAARVDDFTRDVPLRIQESLGSYLVHASSAVGLHRNLLPHIAHLALLQPWWHVQYQYRLLVTFRLPNCNLLHASSLGHKVPPGLTSQET